MLLRILINDSARMMFKAALFSIHTMQNRNKYNRSGGNTLIDTVAFTQFLCVVMHYLYGGLALVDI